MLEITGLRKYFPTVGAPVRAIDDVDLDVASGMLLTMLGPSGCGKTTTLRCIAGLERPDAGRIVIGGRVMVDIAAGIFVAPSERRIGMVFQSYAIWPHMTVFENVAFPLRVARDRRYTAAEIRASVLAALEMVRLGGMESRRATQLSGGQQQRLAFARGIVRRPSLLLLDEPLSNLDARLRDEMRGELKRLQTELGITMVYVTHDQAEALALSDEVALFHAGKIAQRATPDDIYRRPVNRFVADFIGAANFLEGTVMPDDGAQGAGCGRPFVETAHGVLRCVTPHPVPAGANVTLSIRPETIVLSIEPHPGDANALAATIVSRGFLGDAAEYVVDLGGKTLRVRTPPGQQLSHGQAVYAVFAPTDCRVLTS